MRVVTVAWRERGALDSRPGSWGRWAWVPGTGRRFLVWHDGHALTDGEVLARASGSRKTYAFDSVAHAERFIEAHASGPLPTPCEYCWEVGHVDSKERHPEGWAS